MDGNDVAGIDIEDLTLRSGSTEVTYFSQLDNLDSANT